MTSSLLERVSVIVPTYHRPDDLQRCLDSLAKQSIAPAEVVVVVRADDDDARSVAETFRSQLPIVIATPTDPGIVPAAAEGLATASGEIAVFIDDDAEAADETFIERYIEAFTDGVAAVGGHNTIPDRQYERGDEAGGLSWYGRMSGNFYIDTGPARRTVSHLQGCNMAFKAPFPIVDRNLSGDGTYFELDLCLQAASAGEVIYDPSLDVIHHQTPRSGRSWTDPAVVENASYNLAYVLSKHTRSRLQRAARFGFIALVGQRKTWGLVRVASAVAQKELTPKEALHILLVASRGKVRGWRAGRRASSRVASLSPQAASESVRRAEGLSVVILAKDEAAFIERAVESVAWADEVLVVDSGSTDGTQQLAEGSGAKVVDQPWLGWSAQRMAGAMAARNDWVFFLEADEVPNRSLMEAITAIDFRSQDPKTAFSVDRRGDFLGVLLPNSQRTRQVKSFVRIFHKHEYQYDPDAVIHERVLVPLDRVQLLNGVLIHWRGANVKEYISMLDRNTDAEAKDPKIVGANFSPLKATVLPLVRLLWLLVGKGEIRLGWRGVQHALLRAYADAAREGKRWNGAEQPDLVRIPKRYLDQ